MTREERRRRDIRALRMLERGRTYAYVARKLDMHPKYLMARLGVLRKLGVHRDPIPSRDVIHEFHGAEACEHCRLA